jgi:hypothetical protein
MALAARILKPDQHELWDKFVETQPTASVFQTTSWNTLIGKALQTECYYVVCEKKGTILAGMVGHYLHDARKFIWPGIGYNGPVFNLSLNYQEPNSTYAAYQVHTELLSQLSALADHVSVRNQPEVWNARPYTFSRWRVETNYTHLLACESKEEVWQHIKPHLKDVITARALSLSTELQPKERVKFCQDTRVPLKLIDAITEQGFGELVKIENQKGKPQAIALVITSQPDSTLYLDKLSYMAPKNEKETLASLVWLCCKHYDGRYNRINLTDTIDMDLSRTNDDLGAILTPFHTATFNKARNNK